MSILILFYLLMKPEPKVYVIDFQNSAVFTVPRSGAVSTIHPSNGHFHFNPPLELKKGDVIVIPSEGGK